VRPTGQPPFPLHCPTCQGIFPQILSATHSCELAVGNLATATLRLVALAACQLLLECCHARALGPSHHTCALLHVYVATTPVRKHYRWPLSHRDAWDTGSPTRPRSTTPLQRTGLSTELSTHASYTPGHLGAMRPPLPGHTVLLRSDNSIRTSLPALRPWHAAISHWQSPTLL
jgi:hypothetical protein